MKTRHSKWSLLCTLPVLMAGTLALMQPARAADLEKDADGMSVYLGVVPCSALRATSDGISMHGGIPTIPDCHHVMVALFDTTSGRRIEHASVTATVGEYGMYSNSKPLKRMTNAGTVSYGNFFTIPENRMYHIDLRIRRSGVSQIAKTAFDYEDQTQ